MLRQEQETVVNFNAEDQTAIIYSGDPVIMRKLEALSEEFPEYYSIEREYKVDGEVIGKDWKVSNKRLIKFTKPKIYTEEQLEELRARGRALYEMQLKKKEAE